MKKSLTETDKIKNRLTSDLSNLLSEYRNKCLDEEILIDYFVDFLLDANIDSIIVVDVLERKNFGELGKEAALGIKVREGW